MDNDKTDAVKVIGIATKTIITYDTNEIARIYTLYVPYTDEIKETKAGDYTNTQEQK